MAKPAVAIATAPALETDPGSFQILPIAKLVESPSNHRRKSWGNLDELAASIKVKGVLVPICVRPAPTGLVEGAFEIVYGHRRFRAATKAGLPAMPAIVRELTDVEVIEAQVIENLQRTDVHPLEEAEGYEQLLASKDRPYTVDDIAAKVGKSKAYVYARLKLLDLTKESREAYYDGKLSASTALYLARVTPELQKKALEALCPPWRGAEAGPMSAREASSILQREFMCRLQGAPFALDDADLVSAAGACASCPKRSGAQPDLFSDVDAGVGDVCTDIGCYDQKADAAWKKRTAAAEAAGRKVLTEKESKDVLREYGGPVGGYVSLDQTCHADPKYRTYGKLLGKKAAEAIVLARDSSGKVHELLPSKEATRLLKAAGHSFRADSSSGSSSPKSKAQRQAEKTDRALEERVEKQLLELACKKIIANPNDPALWRHAVVSLCAYGETWAINVLWPDPTGKEKFGPAEKRIAAQAAKAKGDELLAALLLGALDMDLGPYGTRRKELLAKLSIDEKSVRARVKEEMKATEKAAAAPAKGKAGELKWVSADDEHTAEPVDGLVYHVAPTPGGKTWVAKVSTTHGDSWKTLGTFTTLLSDAKKLCQADLLERAADGILKNAGAGELTKRDTKGAAVKRKGGRR
jgi:ParB/RepB/Spo0J family partition protein